MSQPKPCLHRPLRAATLALALAGGTLLAQSVEAVRAKLTQGDFAAAATLADPLIAAATTPADDRAEARFLRAYARLVVGLEKELPVAAKAIGATVGTVDFFNDEAEISFPEVVAYAAKGSSVAFTKSGANYTLPRGFDYRPAITFSNTSTTDRSITLSVNTPGYWFADLIDPSERVGVEVGGFGDFFFENFDPTFGLEITDGDETSAPSFRFDLAAGQKLGLRVYPFGDDEDPTGAGLPGGSGDLTFTLASALPARVTATSTAPFKKSGLSFSVKSDFYIPQPAVSFENKGASELDLTLDFGTSTDFGLNLYIDGEYAGYVSEGDGELYGDLFDAGTFEEGQIVVSLDPGQVLTVDVYAAAAGFSFRPLGTLPRTVLVTNGGFATGVFPKFKKGANTRTLFASLLKLDAAVLAPAIADLAAIPVDHENRLFASESLQKREIVVQHADRQATLALLKFAQAYGLLTKTVDMSVDFSAPGFLSDETDPLAVFKATKTLFAAGKATAAERTRLRALLQQAVDHAVAALDAGIDSRPAPETGEYLFGGDSDGGEFSLLVQEGESFLFAGQIGGGDFYQTEVLAFENTSTTAQTVSLMIGGKPDASFFENYSVWLGAELTLDDENVGSLYADAETFSAGRYDYETDDTTYFPFGSFDEATDVWSFTLPAGSTLELEFYDAAFGAELTPTGGLPVGVNAILGAAAIEQTLAREFLTAFKDSLSAPIAPERLGLEDAIAPGATVSLAPLFATKPFNLRALLPEFGEDGIRRGTSGPLLASGLIGGVSVPAWEEFLAIDNNLDLVTAPKITALKITRQPASVELAYGATLTLSITADAYPVPTYQWLKDNVALEGETGPVLTIPETTGADSGSYRVRLTGGAATPAKPLLSSIAKVAVTTAPKTFTTPGTTIAFSGAGTFKGGSYETDIAFTVTTAGKVAFNDFTEDLTGNATYTYKRTSAAVAEFSGTIPRPDSTTKVKAILTFVTPTAGTYTATGTEDGVKLTESGEFTITPPTSG